MKPKPNPPPVTEVSDFAMILRPEDGTEPPVVVGGHAVNLWSLYFLESGVGELADYLPFTSKDLDLVGTMDFLRRLHRRFNGKLLCSPPRSPVLGRLEIPGEGGEDLRIEILHVVKGLAPRELGRTIDLQAGEVFGRVLYPHLLLKAKIENSVDIDQEGRNDVRHVNMMILCVRAFIGELLGRASPEKFEERAMVNVLEDVRKIIGSSATEKASAKWGFDFAKVWPMDELNACGLEKIRRFMKHRFDV